MYYNISTLKKGDNNMIKMNLQFFGGRGGNSGKSARARNGRNGSGDVVISRQLEPNAQGYAYYVTGKRTVITNWDEDGNYYPEGIKTKENIRTRFSTKEGAIEYAKKNGFNYLSL